ncbi:MAG: hypothetical protein ABFD91_14715 [Anaerohalosphaeraceae bacterium]
MTMYLIPLMTLKNTKEWFSRYPAVMGYMACKIALTAYILPDLLRHYQDSTSFNNSTSLLKNHHYYRRHKQLFEGIGNQTQLLQKKFLPIAIFNTFKANMAKWYPDGIPQKTSPEFNDTAFNHMKKLFWANLVHTAKNQSKDFAPHKLFQAHSPRYPELIFTFRVLIPFWLEYGELLFPVYKQARKGSLDAIDKIVRIDKAIIHDPCIAIHVDRILRSKNKVEKKIITTALLYTATHKITTEKTKIMLSGLIYYLWTKIKAGGLIEQEITRPEIRKLFHCLSLDIYKSPDEDLDLIEDDNFRMRTNKAVNFWEQLASPQIKALQRLVDAQRNASKESKISSLAPSNQPLISHFIKKTYPETFRNN